jgi:sugar-specific transcriptional regulator TrmB
MFSPVEEEENVVNILTPWEKELEMMEDWLKNIEPKDGCRETIMQIVGEENSAELLRNFSQEAEHEMTTALKPIAEEGA